jgi:hypothetical protein
MKRGDILEKPTSIDHAGHVSTFVATSYGESQRLRKEGARYARWAETGFLREATMRAENGFQAVFESSEVTRAATPQEEHYVAASNLS